jgi:hypothetical protein
MPHDKVLDHSNTVRRCRDLFLCRALIFLFAVQAIFVVRWSMPLSCELLCRALVDAFVVRWWFDVRCCGLTIKPSLPCGRGAAQF